MGDQGGLSHAIDALQKDAMADTPVNIAAEVQLIYKLYLSLGRVKSHLHYKVVRCAAPSDLVRDAAAKFKPPRRLVAACEAARGLVDGQVDRASDGDVDVRT